MAAHVRTGTKRYASKSLRSVLKSVLQTPQPAGRGAPALHWVLTVWKERLTGGTNIFNNWELGDPLVSVTTSIRFIIFQKETCPDTGRKHYQCYIQLKSKEYHTAFRKMLGIPKNRFVACETPSDSLTLASGLCQLPRRGSPWYAGKERKVLQQATIPLAWTSGGATRLNVARTGGAAPLLTVD